MGSPAVDGLARQDGQQPRQDVQQDQQRTPGQQQQQQAAPPPAAAGGGLPPPAFIVRQACDLLALPPRVASTALTYLHRLAGEDELLPERQAAAALFLASKVEEAAVRTNDMLNAVAAAAPAAAGDARALTAFPCLVGDAYAAAKARLIGDEQLLLRRLRFDICADQPHRHLYVLARCWGAPAPAVRAATALLNDGLLRCAACGSPAMPAATAAAAALHLGAQLCRLAVQPSGWWRATGISDAALRDACAAMLELLEAAPMQEDALNADGAAATTDPAAAAAADAAAEPSSAGAAQAGQPAGAPG